MNQSLAFVVVLFATLAICEIGYAGLTNRPRYIQCQSNSECMPGFCCTIGQNKFSIPQCKPLENEGGVCRPGKPMTLNTTLMYPDGSQVELTSVHVMFCPCGYGLACDAADGVCRDPSQLRGFNSLSGEPSFEED